MIHVWTCGREEPSWQRVSQSLFVDEDWRLKLKVHTFMCRHTFTLTSFFSHFPRLILTYTHLSPVSFHFSRSSSSHLSPLPSVISLNPRGLLQFSCLLSCHSGYNLIFCPVTLYLLSLQFQRRFGHFNFHVGVAHDICVSKTCQLWGLRGL